MVFCSNILQEKGKTLTVNILVERRFGRSQFTIHNLLFTIHSSQLDL